MSTGTVVCSICRREAHQNGPNSTWLHCEDDTPRCIGASSDWPLNGEPVGQWCGIDGTGSGNIPRFTTMPRTVTEDRAPRKRLTKNQQKAARRKAR